MKLLILILFIPMIALGQTIHIKDDKANYKGKVSVPGVAVNEVYARTLSAVKSCIKNYSDFRIDSGSFEIKLTAEIKLESPAYGLMRSLLFSLKITAKDNEYKYHIDSVHLKEQVRGDTVIVTSSKKLWKDMEESGTVAIHTERVLNEIDMTLQKMLAVLRSRINF